MCRGSSSSSTPISSARSSSRSLIDSAVKADRQRGAATPPRQPTKTLERPAGGVSAARQAGRAVLERRPAARAAPRRGASRPGTAAVSIRSPAACCRSAWGRRRDWRASCSRVARPIASACCSASAPPRAMPKVQIVERCPVPHVDASDRARGARALRWIAVAGAAHVLGAQARGRAAVPSGACRD